MIFFFYFFVLNGKYTSSISPLLSCLDFLFCFFYLFSFPTPFFFKKYIENAVFARRKKTQPSSRLSATNVVLVQVSFCLTLEWNKELSNQQCACR